MATENLWGSLPTADASESPAAVLRSQATVLGEQTSNSLLGRIHADKDGTTLITELTVRAPSLNNYEIALVRSIHEAVMYPVKLYNLLESDWEFVECEDAEAFKTKLGQILQSTKVTKVISSLLAQIDKSEIIL